MVFDKQEIKSRFKNCDFSHPLIESTIQKKILDNLSYYKSYEVSRGGKLVIDFGDEDFIVKIDLFSKVSSLTADQYYFYKENVRNTPFVQLIAELQAFEINMYYIYIQERVEIFNNEDQYLYNTKLSQYNLCQIDKIFWQRLFNKYDIPCSNQLMYWCHIASTLYSNIVVMCLLFKLRKNMMNDIHPNNIGFNKYMLPKIIDF